MVELLVAMVVHTCNPNHGRYTQEISSLRAAWTIQPDPDAERYDRKQGREGLKRGKGEGEMRNYNPGGSEMLARRYVKKIQS